MQDDSQFLWHGALFGLFLIAAFGVFLLGRRARIRAALAPYVGEEPARWLLWLVGFGYVYGALNAVGQATTIVPMYAPEMGMPLALAFGHGAGWYSLLSFRTYPKSPRGCAWLHERRAALLGIAVAPATAASSASPSVRSLKLHYSRRLVG